MKKIIILIGVLLLMVSNIFADDVSIDSSGNVKTGVSNANAELEVTGASGEGGILGSASGTGASGVYGINTTYGNYGILGYDNYGVFGYSLSGYAGYFQGNSLVTGNLTVNGTISGPGIGDITAVNAGTGLTGGATSGAATLSADTTYLQRRVSSSCIVGSSIRAINADGTVECQTDNTGITAESDPEVGSNTTDFIPKWNGSALITGTIFDNGNIGIRTTSPSSALTVHGTIESTGGIKFPDGTVQTTSLTKALCSLYILTGKTPIPAFCLYHITDTGQTGDYTATFGEDSDYTINPPSYINNGNGTVKDSVTGLMWQREDDNQTYNWYQATGTYHATYNPSSENVCGALVLGGYSDWRLPDPFELMGIVSYGLFDPAIDNTAFPNTNSSNYWSSTTYASEPIYAWLVDFFTGSLGFTDKFRSFMYVRCVRGGQSGSFGDFQDNGDGTVTDNVTSLMWQREDDNTTRLWESAITYCENLPLSMYSDWRLPNIKELSSIVDLSRYNPAVDNTAFPNTNAVYWSSTTYAGFPDVAWGVLFSNGGFLLYGKSDSYEYVRCVRGGQ